MGLLTSRLSKFRDDPRLLRVPPYLSLFCILGGIIWILLLPLNQYSRQTYISENALLPGQVHTYFGGSEQNVFRAYRHELNSVLLPRLKEEGIGNENVTRLPVASEEERNAKIQDLFRNAGLKTATQRYEYLSAGRLYKGENVYAVLHAPRGDGTEAIVLTAAIKNIDEALNINGIPLLISLARYFKRWSLWSKDIIFLVTPDSTTGPQAWIDAYHSTHDPAHVADLTLKSGSLQGAVCIDFPSENRFETFHVAYDGINGQLPNLDLFNTAVSIASGQMGIGTSIQFQHNYAKHDDQHTYPARLQTLVRGMSSQALGHATGPHSVFMSYHIDAITLTSIGAGWQDEMAFGRTVESICRSLNNLLEKLHQSFFFYLLMQSNRFVSIGTYLPSAMTVAAAYTIMAIYLWILSGYKITESVENKKEKRQNGKISTEKRSLNIEDKSEEEIVKALEEKKAVAAKATKSYSSRPKLHFQPIDRHLTLPITILTALHLASLLPVYILTHINRSGLAQTFTLLAIMSLVLPAIFAASLAEMPNNTNVPAFNAPTHEQYIVLKSLSLLLLGLFLTVLATLNFSLSIFLGIVCIPLAFVDRQTPSMDDNKKSILPALQYLLLVIMSPAGITLMLGLYGFYTTGESDMVLTWLVKFAFGFNIWRSWGVIVGVFCIWWPAWTVAAMLVASSWFTTTTPTTDAAEVISKADIKKEKAGRSPGVYS